MTVGLAIVLVATVYFSIISPGFRMVVGAVIVAVIVLVIALVVWVMNRSDGYAITNSRPQQNSVASEIKIEPQELDLAEYALGRAVYRRSHESSRVPPVACPLIAAGRDRNGEGTDWRALGAVTHALLAPSQRVGS
jgi:hypothetical protein